MPIVVDCSVAVAWCMEDERTPYTQDLLSRLAGRTEVAVVPSHWLVELANVLGVAEKRSRISRAKAGEFLALLGYLAIEFEPPSISHTRRVFSLAHAHRLSAYDAAYLEIAIRRSLPLATHDGELRRAAAALGIECPAPPRSDE